MTKVYLIRHAEAEGNIYRRAHGWYDGRVTAKGRRQIGALAERFRDVSVDALYASDLSRTRETAGAITRYHDLELRTEPRLREVNMGQWEDRPWGNLTRDYPEAMAAFNDDPDNWRAPGAETFPALKRRMKDIVCELAARHDGQTIVCVSHGMAIRSLLSELLGVPSAEIHKCPHGDNTHVSLLEVDGEEIRVVFYNDASHLGEDLSTFARQSWWRKPGLADSANLSFVPLDPNKEPELYVRLYGATWYAVHGTIDGYNPPVYLNAAKRHFSQDPEAIVKVLRGDRFAGVTELDTERDRELGCGWICLCYIAEAHRRQQLGVQLIGHAVSLFRRLGRRNLRLNVFEGNTDAIAFYREYGFVPIGKSSGAHGDLLLMEKDLR